MLSVIWSLIAFVGTKFVAKKFGKKEWIMYSATFSVVVYAILFFFPLENPLLFIIINGICYLGVSGFQVLVWALVNDAIDYQELQTGKRNEGIVYSAYTFFRKLANAVSGSMSSFALAIAGFQVNEAVQNVSILRTSLENIYRFICCRIFISCSGIKIYLPSYKRENS